MNLVWTIYMFVLIPIMECLKNVNCSSLTVKTWYWLSRISGPPACPGLDLPVNHLLSLSSLRPVFCEETERQINISSLTRFSDCQSSLPLSLSLSLSVSSLRHYWRHNDHNDPWWRTRSGNLCDSLITCCELQHRTSSLHHFYAETQHSILSIRKETNHLLSFNQRQHFNLLV